MKKLERIIANDGLVYFGDCTLVVNEKGVYYVIPNTELNAYDIDNCKELSDADLVEFCNLHSSEIDEIYENLCNVNSYIDMTDEEEIQPTL